MRNWDIPSMIIETRKQIIPEMVIPRRPYDKVRFLQGTQAVDG